MDGPVKYLEANETDPRRDETCFPILFCPLHLIYPYIGYLALFAFFSLDSPLGEYPLFFFCFFFLLCPFFFLRASPGP
jgi:hypothetical protein